MNENRKRHIRQLLELYYAGNSSATDEAELCDYFNSPEADPEFENDRAIIAAMTCGDNIEVPSDLEGRLCVAIGSWEHAELSSQRQKGKFRIKPFRLLSGIAAAVLLFVSISPLLFRSRNSQPTDTFTDPKEAYAETQRVINLFANTLDKSLQGIQIAGRNQERALDIAINQLNNL